MCLVSRVIVMVVYFPGEWLFPIGTKALCVCENYFIFVTWKKIDYVRELVSACLNNHIFLIRSVFVVFERGWV